MPNNPKNPAKFSKNLLSLDMAVAQRSLPLYWAAYVAVTLWLAWQASLVWWGAGLVMPMAVILSLAMALRPKVRHLSCISIDGIWEIGINKSKGSQLWQGYLTDLKTMYVFDKSLFLRFYVVEPKRRTLTVVIHRRDVSDDDFRKLLGLYTMSMAKSGA